VTRAGGGRSECRARHWADRCSVCATLHNGNVLRLALKPRPEHYRRPMHGKASCYILHFNRTKEGRWQKRLWHCSRAISVENPRVPRSRSGSTVRTGLRTCVTRTFRCSRRTAGSRDADARPPPRSRISGFEFKRRRVADVHRSRPAVPNLQGAAGPRLRPLSRDPPQAGRRTGTTIPGSAGVSPRQASACRHYIATI
jgi:hypothetical protein